MAVKIRLARRGRKKMAMYDIVVAESTSPRDGKFVEKIGTYNPNTDPSTVVLKSDRAVYWLMVGAQPTDTARSVLSHEGVMYRKHLQVGVNKGAITQEQADEKYTTWKEDKQNRIAGAADTKTQTKEQSRAARLEAERKVSEIRAEAIVKKNRVEEPVAEVAPVEEVAPTEVTATEVAAAEAAEEREVVNSVPVAAIEEAPATEAIGEMPVELTAEVAAPTEAVAAEVTPAVEVPIADIVPADEVVAVEATVAEETPAPTEVATTEEAPVAEETPAVEEAPVAETAPEVDATPAPVSEEAAAEETEKKDTPAAE
ncbi:MAG: 30S ribosomal protein S16 [Spirosoma sp.]|nr:30S ribosomal protein S16 [Spirosoma sp.]